VLQLLGERSILGHKSVIFGLCDLCNFVWSSVNEWSVIKITEIWYSVGSGGSFPEVMQLGNEAEHSPPSSAKVKNGGAISTLSHVFMAWCLINYTQGQLYLHLDRIWRKASFCKSTCNVLWLSNRTINIKCTATQNVNTNTKYEKYPLNLPWSKEGHRKMVVWWDRKSGVLTGDLKSS
jgi:hypothetical protein